MNNLQVAFDIKGIDRRTPYSDHNREDGWCDELINWRHRNGRMEPVGTKPKLFNLPARSFQKIWLHDQDNVHNYIGLSDQALYLITMETGVSTLIANGFIGEVKIEFIKRFMVVIHEEGMDRFIWNGDENKYDNILIPSRPMLLFSRSDIRGKIVYTEKAVGAEAILAKYYKALNNENRDEGLLTGGIMLRAAFRMYDGSYVLHSIPEYIQLGLNMTMYEQAVEGGGDDNDLNWIKFYMSKINVSFNSALFISIDKNIFTDVVIFACKNEELFDFNEDTFDDDVLTDKVHNASTDHDFDVDFHDIFEGRISEDFKNMVDSPSWYKVHEISIEAIQNGEAETTQEIDTKGFYQDYATRETLTVDQFSHHSLIGSVAYNYNSRLIIGDIKTLFATYRYFPLNPYTLVGDYILFPDEARYSDDWNYIADRNCKFIVTLNTSSGDVTKIIDAGVRPFAEHDNKEWVVLSLSVLGYPDARAKSISILVQNGNQWYKIHEFKLKASSVSNYAYYHSPDFSSAPVEITDRYEYNFNAIMVGTDFPVTQQVNINNYTNKEFRDENRLQISEVNNPFLFPAENSYQVGTGKILDVATNTEPLSSGQFGEHPIIVFTSKGRYVMFQGLGDVTFSNIKPLDGDVPDMAVDVTSVSGGVVYSTRLGLFIAVGTQVTQLSEVLTGEVNEELKNNPHYQFFLSDTRLINIVNKLSTVDFLTYLSGATIGYDHDNKELLCTNNAFSYSYTFNFKSGYWSKLDTSFKLLINDYPKLYGLREVDVTGIINISDEVYSEPIPTLITTQPLHLSAPEVFKVVQRLRINTMLETKDNTHAGFYLFGSSNLIDWQFITGRNHLTGKIKNILLTRSGNKWKYYTVVIAADLKPNSNVNTITSIIQTKMDQKPR
ncbi:hypothetical protein [Draconibacterium mangrovi]|uniref:hypothetical protein n=1 Tax=Draconibacterium mangrovi TaxID=2697469 RepID=UPI0013D84796|nr:hypothetical protein [Draconibacterium mangrovi]